MILDLCTQHYCMVFPLINMEFCQSTAKKPQRGKTKETDLIFN